MLVSGDVPAKLITDLKPIAAFFQKSHKKIEGYIITEIYCSQHQSALPLSPMGEVLSQELGAIVIPYDKTKRESLPGARKLHARYLGGKNTLS
jgi:hypothetical protein